MSVVDIAIARSLGIHERYQSLENMYMDQLQHAKKLKDANTSLQQDLDNLSQRLALYQTLLEQYQIKDIQQLETLLAKNSRQNSAFMIV